MAKSKKQTRKGRSRKVRVTPSSSALRPGMLAASGEYVKLLSNPCTGPLVHAPGSSSGGLVTRFESDFIIGETSSNTCGFMVISPGAINNQPLASSARGRGLIAGASTTDTLDLVGNTLNEAQLPGRTYLVTNASSYRCIAACVQVFWPGTELNRQGFISAAQATYGLGSLSTNVKVANLRSQCPVVQRMPTDHAEFKWAPNFSDGLFRNPDSETGPEDGHSALLLTWSGLPTNVGIRVRIVCVYEWHPKITGLTISSNTSTSDAGSIQDARRQLDRRDANWWMSAGHAAYNFLSGMTVAYANTRGPNFPGQPRLTRDEFR